MNSIRDVLTRASVLAGEDLVASFESTCKKIPLDADLELDAGDEVERIRVSLPNSKTRKRFDREMQKTAKQATSQSAQQRAFKFRKSNKKALAKLEKALKSAGVENPHPTVIGAHLWKQTQHIIADATGWAAKFYSRLCWHRIGVSLAHRAALCFDEITGVPRYSYVGHSREALRARHVLALGLLLLRLSAHTGRRFQGWMRLVTGIPLAALIAALRDPFSGRRPHRNTVDGTHRAVEKTQNPDTGKLENTATDGNVGYLTALKAVGLCYTRQAKWRDGQNPAQLKGWADIRPEEMFSAERANGWFTSLNRYWIVSDRFTDPKDAARKAELYVAWLAGSAFPEICDFETLQAQVTESATVEPHESPPS